MNEEVDIDGILEQELGPDEDDEEAVSAYALNRQKLNASRKKFIKIIVYLKFIFTPLKY